MLLKLELEQIGQQIHYFSGVGVWVGGLCGRIETEAISAFSCEEFGNKYLMKLCHAVINLFKTFV